MRWVDEILKFSATFFSMNHVLGWHLHLFSRFSFYQFSPQRSDLYGCMNECRNDSIFECFDLYLRIDNVNDSCITMYSPHYKQLFCRLSKVMFVSNELAFEEHRRSSPWRRNEECRSAGRAYELSKLCDAMMIQEMNARFAGPCIRSTSNRF